MANNNEHDNRNNNLHAAPAVPIASDLHEAILANSSAVVKLYLDQGANPNRSPQLAPVGVISASNQERARDLHRTLGRVFRSRQSGSIHPLHVAVCNAYHHSTFGKEEALSIIRYLLDAGADTQSTCNGIAFCKVGTHPSVTIATPKTSAKVALFLKRFPLPGKEEACCNTMDEVASIILEADAQRRENGNGLETTQTASIPKETLSTYASLLDDTDYTDIVFVCPDGEIPAHKCVLAASVPYFRAALQGPWKEGTQDHEWRTTNSVDVMKGILKFIYTGEIDDEWIRAKASHILSVASEYQLDAVQRVCEEHLTQALESPESVKASLDLAHLHSLNDLKLACFDYVRDHSTTVLVHHSFRNMADEAPDLWEELVTAIQQPPRKRKRSSDQNESDEHAENAVDE
jgi:hypothetical protein